ncbi:MAG: DNA-binding domain-containing protein [Chthoniobacterales bacterium]
MSKNNSKALRPNENPVHSRAQLKELQRLMATAVFRPLNSRDGMQSRWSDGRRTSTVAASFIKPNDRLSSFDRLEIYNRVYWFRVLDCLYDDYPGLRAIVGEKKFLKLATAYLAKYPSASFTLRNLGQRLGKFLREEPKWIVPFEELALDMARFEWAQVVAFDDAARPKITTDDVLDTPASKLRLGLQPYLSLLELNYAVDKFLLAVKKRDGDVLRDEASNTFEAMPQTTQRKRPVRRPKRERIYLVVHRYDNMLYYKRLELEAFALLEGLQRGMTVEKACLAALSDSTRTGVDWTRQIQEWFHDWSALGWFCRPGK